MNALHFDISMLAPTAGKVLVGITVVLAAGLLIQSMLVRIAAARYAVLFWSLAAVGCCPLFVLIADWLPTSFSISWPAPLVRALEPTDPIEAARSMAIVTDGYEPKGLVQNAAEAPAVSVVNVLIAIWIFGTLLQLIRLAWDVRVTRRIRAEAKSAVSDLVAVRADTEKFRWQGAGNSDFRACGHSFGRWFFPARNHLAIVDDRSVRFRKAAAST